MIFFFPGQGTQFVGMGKKLLEKYQIARNIFDEANDILGYNLEQLCLEGPEKQLTNTQYAQPAILTYQHILTSLLKERSIVPTVVAGHSLGEFSGILASGMLNFENALRLIQKRGELMETSDPEHRGTMAAVLGLKSQDVIDICQQVSQENYVEAVNFNTPTQVVISGLKEGVDEASKRAIEKGARHVLPLAVSGGFHSKLMSQAADQFAEYIKDITFHTPNCFIISNVTATFYTEKQVKELLPLQMKSPVQWVKSIEYLVNKGYKKAIEVSKGTVISGMVRKITKEITVTNVEEILK